MQPKTPPAPPVPRDKPVTPVSEPTSEPAPIPERDPEKLPGEDERKLRTDTARATVAAPRLLQMP